jgi:DHA3 family tetracycline resistance protein-like MFS transporter
VLLSQVIGGLGYTFNSGALEAWITDEIGEEAVGKAFVRYGQVTTVTGFAGIAFGVYLATINLSFALIAGGLMLIAVGVAIALWMPETGFKPNQSSEQSSTFGNMRQTLSQGIDVAKSQPVVWLFLLMGVVFGAYSETFDRLWEAHLLANFTFYDLFSVENVVWFGIIRAGSRLINLIASEVVVRRVDMTNHMLLARILLVGQAFIMLGTIVLGLTGNFTLAILAVWTIWLMRHISYPISGAWLNQVIESRSRATVLSLISQSDALGQMVGGPSVGWLATVRSMRVALVVGAGLLMPAFPLYGKYAFKKNE